MNESTSAVEQAIAARIARVKAAKERERAEREEFAAARSAGVTRRNAAKLRRLEASRQGEPSTTQETPMSNSPFRSIPCPGCRAQRTVRRVGTVTVSRVVYDVVRCPQAGCGLIWCAPPERPGVAA